MAAEDELNIKGQEPTVNVDGITDPEYELDDPEETAIAERKAMTTVTKINPMARTFRSYMEDFVNPVLFDGLQSLTKERPDNPVEFLAYYLIQNNPKLKAGDNTTSTENPKESS